MEKQNFDIVIIGSGYRAMVTAYLLLKKNKKVLIISKSKDLFGIMKPLNWKGGKFDKGFHFFDGINEHQKKFLNEFVGENILYDFGFGGASLTNNKIYPYHAIPYWPYLGSIFCIKVFLSYIFKYNNNIHGIIENTNSYQDLLNLIPNKIKEILTAECERRIGLHPKELSNRFQDFPFFNFRQTIFPDKLSTFLKKKFEYFDHTIASRRSSIGLECISLYPKGQNMGVAAEIMKQKIINKGAILIDSSSIKIKKDATNKVLVILEGKEIIANKIFIVTEIDDALNFFEKEITNRKNIYYLPQIFYFFSTDKINSRFQYVQGNTIGNLINRANNMSLYGEKTSNNENVISAEVADSNKDLWDNPEKYLWKVWHELKLMGLVSKNQNYSGYEIYPIKKTAPLQLVEFNKSCEDLKLFLKNNYEDRVLFPGLGERTSRSFFLDDVEKTIELNE